MEINLYPEMNKKIVDILRLGGDDEENRFQMYAAALIEAYRASGLEPDEIPKWTPVSERLPEKWRDENGEPIEFNVMLPEAKEAITLCFDGSQWFGFDWNGMKVTGYYTVTHWMPLPQPPKDKP